MKRLIVLGDLYQNLGSEMEIENDFDRNCQNWWGSNQPPESRRYQTIFNRI